MRSVAFSRISIVQIACRSFSSESESARQRALQSRGLPTKKPIPGVDKILLVASGKGGVGKSTTAVNLALALSRVAGDKSVGLLDADIYGPSIPKMMNTVGRLAEIENDMILPVSALGLKTMSMGNLLSDSEAPVVWRGLMVMSALQRLLYRVAWSPLDLLVLDMPPGTGDTQLSVSQSAPVSGAVIVTTGQEVAMMDARKGAKMFEKVGIPVLGLVHNMASHVCGQCGHEDSIFGTADGVRRVGDELGVPVLTEIPLVGELSSGCDDGRPIVVTKPSSRLTEAYLGLAEKVVGKLWV